jgi:hypothetical protein
MEVALQEGMTRLCTSTDQEAKRTMRITGSKRMIQERTPIPREQSQLSKKVQRTMSADFITNVNALILPENKRERRTMTEMTK